MNLTKEDKEILEDSGYSEEDYELMESPPFLTGIEGWIKWNEFRWAIKAKDFSIGDIIVLNGISFEVISFVEVKKK